MLRAAAITLVVIVHSVLAYPGITPAVEKAFDIGGYGVDLFFVLSGWLIGSLWFREQIRSGSVHPLKFLSRRWLRTVPPYYVAMIIGWLGVYRARQTPFDFGYLIFIQNYYPHLPFFGVSWSLCIEEQFYLVLPLILMLAMRWKWPVIIAAFALVAAGPFMRGHIWQKVGAFEFTNMTTSTHLHADGLIMGVTAAAIAAYRPAMWKRIKRVARWLAIPAVLVYLSFMIWPFKHQYIYGYPLLALVFVTLVAALESSPPVLWSNSRIVYAIAISSYSTYLVHLPVRHAMVEMTHRFFGGSTIALTVLMLSGYIIFSALFYFLIEKTALRLRDRVTAPRPTLAVAGGPV